MNGPEFLIPIILFLSTAVVLIVFRKFTNEERIALIDKGVDANLFNRKYNYGSSALKIGLLFIGAGLGLLFGSFLDAARVVNEEAAYFSMLLIFGGIGLFAAYLVERKAAAKQKD